MKLANYVISLLAAAMLVGPMATPCAAQDTTADWTWSSPSAVETDPWRFNLNGYGWLPKAPVTISTPGGREESIPEKFSKILDDLKFAAMGEAEIHKGPFGVFVSPIFYKGEDDEHFTGLLGASRKVTLDETVWLIKYGASYDLGMLRLGENPQSPTVTLQPYVGGLFFHDKIKLDVSPGALGVGLRVRETIEFNTVIVGLNTLWDLSDRWSLRIGGNIGGWDVDDVKKTYDVVGDIAYHFEMYGQPAKVFAGYRYLHVNFDDDSLDINLKVDVKGPFVGFGLEF